MAKYKFRLATLQKIRVAHRDEKRAALADAYRAEQVLHAKREEIEEELDKLNNWKRAATEGAHLNINQLIEAQRYEVVLKSNQQELDRQNQLFAIELERRRQLLVEADRDVRALELLDEKHRKQHQKQERKLETKRLDEIAMMKQPNISVHSF